MTEARETNALAPPSRRGPQRHTDKCFATFECGAAGEVRHNSIVRGTDLPRRADAKVALHQLDRRVAPSSKEGPKRFCYAFQPFPSLPRFDLL